VFEGVGLNIIKHHYGWEKWILFYIEYIIEIRGIMLYYYIMFICHIFQSDLEKQILSNIAAIETSIDLSMSSAIDSMLLTEFNNTKQRLSRRPVSGPIFTSDDQYY
jgi:hypothetical protein